jgi:hypothetical protein
LEDYIGTHETLTLEFKSMQSLLADDKKEKNTRMEEAATDVAAMANEQGGEIVYGIAELGKGMRRMAGGLEDGFGVEHGVSREWFLQFIRDRVHPPLPDIDAVEVPLDDSGQHFALVILVPQARGMARQTGDLLFWRRNAQGIHPMTVQEIEDVRQRAVRPVMDLSVTVQRMEIPGDTTLELPSQFAVQNRSPATSSFAVITLGFMGPISATPVKDSDWRLIEASDVHKIVRLAVASGSSKYWSPITPGFMLILEKLTIRTSFDADVDPFQSRDLGLARLDHDGGTKLYRIVLQFSAPRPADRIQLEALSEGQVPDRINGVRVSPVFRQM